MATRYDEDVPEDEKVIDATTIHLVDVPEDEKVMDATTIHLVTTPFDHGKDDNSAYATAFSLLVKLGAADDTTPTKTQLRSSYNTPDTMTSASTASPSMIWQGVDDDHDDHDDQDAFSSFQSVQSAFTSIFDSLPDQTYVGSACESLLSQTCLKNSNSSTNNNQKHNLTTTQPSLAAEPSSSIQTITVNNSANEETLQPLVDASSEKAGVVSRQRHVQAQEKIRQKLKQMRIALPTALPKPNEKPKLPPLEELVLSNNQSEKETSLVTTESPCTDEAPSTVSDTARKAVRRAEVDLKQVYAKLELWGHSAVKEESSSREQLNPSTSSSYQQKNSTLTAVSSRLSDEQRGRDRAQLSPPSLLDHDIPSSFYSENNNGMDQVSEDDSLFFDDIGFPFDEIWGFSATRVSARPCVPEISRVAANIGQAPTKDVDSLATPFGEEQEAKPHSAPVPTTVSIVQRFLKTRIYVDPASSEMTANLGSSAANQSSFPGITNSSRPEIYFDDLEAKVLGGKSVIMPAMSECGSIVLVGAYDEIEAQTSPHGDPTTTADKKTLSKENATSWIGANKFLLILIILVTSAAMVAAILGILITNSI